MLRLASQEENCEEENSRHNSGNVMSTKENQWLRSEQEIDELMWKEGKLLAFDPILVSFELFGSLFNVLPEI